MAVEMNKIHVQPAPHHAPSRDWRVDPARKQEQRASGNSDRQATCAGIFAVGDIGRMRQNLDREIEFGMREIDFETELSRLLQRRRSASISIELSGKRLSARRVEMRKVLT